MKLSEGRSPRLELAISNRGPAAARVDRVAFDDPRGLRLAVVQLGAERSAKSALRFEARTIAPGASLPLYVELSYPVCLRPGTSAMRTVDAFDVRLKVAGGERTQRVVLDDPLQVACRGPRRAP